MLCLCSLLPVFLCVVVLFICPRCSHSVVSSSAFSRPGVIVSGMVFPVVVSCIVVFYCLCLSFDYLMGAFVLCLIAQWRFIMCVMFVFCSLGVVFVSGVVLPICVLEFSVFVYCVCTHVVLHCAWRDVRTFFVQWLHSHLCVSALYRTLLLYVDVVSLGVPSCRCFPVCFLVVLVSDHHYLLRVGVAVVCVVFCEVFLGIKFPVASGFLAFPFMRLFFSPLWFALIFHFSCGYQGIVHFFLHICMWGICIVAGVLGPRLACVSLCVSVLLNGVLYSTCSMMSVAFVSSVGVRAYRSRGVMFWSSFIFRLLVYVFSI